jgi:hypothetical protein
MQPTRVAAWTCDVAGVDATLAAGCVALAVPLAGALTPTPLNPTAIASAAALPNIATFLIPVIGPSSQFKFVADTEILHL